MKPNQKIQEELYAYPYHYLPSLQGDRFQQHLHWSWGYRYLGRLRVVFDLLRGLEFDSLLDIGCGDGRFLRETNKAYEGKELLGIDSSKKTIVRIRHPCHAPPCDPTSRRPVTPRREPVGTASRTTELVVIQSWTKELLERAPKP